MTDLKGIKTVHSLTLETSETQSKGTFCGCKKAQSVEIMKQSVEKVQMKC